MKASEDLSVEFYSDRINHFDTERKVFCEYEKLIQPKKTELHMLEWENRQEAENDRLLQLESAGYDREIQKINSEVSEARSLLDELRLSQKSRQEQIQKLSQLQYPVQQDTTYIFVDQAPTKFSARVVSKIKKASDAVSPLLSKQIKSGPILVLERRLTDETHRLHKNVGDFEVKAREAFDTITKKSHFSEQTFLPMKLEAAGLADRLDSCDRQCFHAVYELLSLRLKIMTTQREEIDELERLRRDKEYFEAKDAEMKEALLLETALMKKRIGTEAEASTRDLKYQISSLDHHIKIQKVEQEKWAKRAQLQEAKQQRLLVAAEHSKARYEALRRRFALEMEGYENEALFLQKRFRQLQRQFEVTKSAS